MQHRVTGLIWISILILAVACLGIASIASVAGLTYLALAESANPFQDASGSEVPEPKKPPSKGKTFKVTCEKCGNWWTVAHTSGPVMKDQTVKWCEKDGEACPTGIGLVLKCLSAKGKGDQEAARRLEMEFIRHCRGCEGCRMDTFTPDEWSKVPAQ